MAGESNNSGLYDLMASNVPHYRVKLLDPDTGAVIIINRPGTSEPMVTIYADGTLIVGEGYTPDGAATEFWQAMASALPAMGWTSPILLPVRAG